MKGKSHPFQLLGALILVDYVFDLRNLSKAVLVLAEGYFHSSSASIFEKIAFQFMLLIKLNILEEVGGLLLNDEFLFGHDGLDLGLWNGAGHVDFEIVLHLKHRSIIALSFE